MKRVIIIGAGLAGLSAAIELAKQNVGSELISPQPSERAQSVLAEGGINAALDLMGEGDSPAEHCADTLRGGCELADPRAVRSLTDHAPELVRSLSALGVPFQMEGERLVQRNFGGQKKKRTAYAKSSTGKAIMTALIDEARKYEASGLIRRWPHHTLEDLFAEGGACAGVSVRDTYRDMELRFSGPVILACGGLNGLFPGRTTGTTQNTGDAAALAFARGAVFGNLEMLQYHPTTVAISGKRLLVSEAARGEGGRLFTVEKGRRRYFMEEKYPELGNLMPRDVISREMALLDGPAWLDLTGLPRATWAKRLPDLRAELRHYLNLDPAKEPVPVSPGIHFFMGGILVDRFHRTSLENLFAAGECACQYHGANRLGGNSLLGALYGGIAAARSAAEAAEEGEPEARGFAAARQETPGFSPRLGDILSGGLGILREETTLTNALDSLDALSAESLTERERLRLALGRAMLLSALARRESRGAHTRTDFPERDDGQFRKTTAAAMGDGTIAISFIPISEGGEAGAP